MVTTKTGNTLNKVMNLFRNIDPEIQANAIQVFLTVATAKQEEGVTMQEIARRTELSQAATSRNVAMFSAWTRHKTAGPALIEAYEDPMNRRQKFVRLTAKGRRFAEQMSELMGA